MSWMTLPPLPITSLILSVGIIMLNILGAQRLRSSRGWAITGLMISSRIYRRPFAALFKSIGNDLVGQAVDLDIHLDRRNALAGAAHLKSISPWKSSTPWMSSMVIQRSPSVIRPQEMPATGALMGTPASISATWSRRWKPER